MANQPPPYPGHEKSSQGYPGQVDSYNRKLSLVSNNALPPQADQYHTPPQPGYGQSPAPVVVQHQYVAPRYIVLDFVLDMTYELTFPPRNLNSSSKFCDDS